MLKRRLIDALILGLVSFTSARIAVNFLIVPEGMAPFWFSNGVVLVMLLRRPPRHWPLLLAVAFVGFIVNMWLVGGFPLRPNLVYGFANVAEPLIAALLIRRFEPNISLNRLRALGVLLVAAVVACSIGATIAWSAGPIRWALWMMDDLLGMVLIAPAILAFWPVERQAGTKIAPRQAAEILLLALSISVVVSAVFMLFEDALGIYFSYAIIPFLLWAALRFNLKGAVLSSLLVGVLTIGFTLFGIGPFAGLSTQMIDSSLAIQTFLAIVLLTHLALGVALVERQDNQAAAARSEAQFRQLVETTHEGVWTMDTNDNTTYVNPRMAKLLGYAVPDMYGLHVSRLVHVLDRAQMLESLALGRQGISSQHEIQLVAKDDTRRWVLMTTSPIRGDAGEFIGSLGMVTDITERKSLEAQMIHAQRVESLGTLAGGIAHDFNNILTAIVGNVGVIRSMIPADHPAQARLNIVQSANNRATELVRQILTFSRHGESQQKIVNVRVVVDEAVALLTATVPAMINIDVAFDPQPCEVMADPSQIHQIVMNLGTNAVYAMRKQGGTLRISLEPMTLLRKIVGEGSSVGPGEVVRLTVEDDGEGMDDATLQRMFDPFFSTKGPSVGTGLGLPVVLGIVKSHGGALTVTSRKNHGTKFELYFPAVCRDVRQVDASHVKPMQRGAGERILFVDDEKTITQFVTSYLAGLGYAIQGVTDAQRALALFADRPNDFDAIITDYGMAGMSGIELVRRAQMIRPGIPTVLVSGFLSPESSEEAEQLGIKFQLVKPDFIDQLPVVLGKIFPHDGGSDARQRP